MYLTRERLMSITVQPKVVGKELSCMCPRTREKDPFDKSTSGIVSLARAVAGPGAAATGQQAERACRRDGARAVTKDGLRLLLAWVDA